MTSLKETIKVFATQDNVTGDEVVRVEDIPGIIVSAIQDLADTFRDEAKFSEEVGDNPSRCYTLRSVVGAIGYYQEHIVHELM